MRDITIAGGGLAGLALGLLLRERDVPVTLHEAGDYPRHRVCGEFISGDGAALCKKWLAPSANVLELNSIRFCTERRRSPVFALPKSALAISRYDLDSMLARNFEAMGGRLKTRSRLQNNLDGEGFVRATGRRISKHRSGCWVGVKFHAKNLPLSADLELHFSKGAYFGLSRLPDGITNVCGLIRSDALPRNLGHDHFSIVAARLHPVTQAAFGHAQVVENSFCSVSGISLKPETAQSSRECRIGDSISMIAPLTGNGMSMAFESALIAADALVHYSKGARDWENARKSISQMCDEKFTPRLRAAWFLQNCVMHSAGQMLLLSSLRTAPGLFPWLFRRTRS
jgi:flavin-dependent dehydrogenase